MSRSLLCISALFSVVEDLEAFLRAVGSVQQFFCQFCAQFLREIAFVSQVVFQACPKIHGDRSELDFNLYISFFVFQENRNGYYEM